MTNIRFTAVVLAAALTTLPVPVPAEEGLSSYQAIVSVADQKIAVLRDGAVIAKYPISTSKYGVGDGLGSYKTPLGKMKVCEKLGGNLPTGAVIKHRRATGEVIAVNAPGRDPIVTRVLWLDGLEASNSHAKDRSIYIHGTAEERTIGKPASYGCIRMKSEDVISLYNDLGVGATIDVIPEKLPKLAKYTPPKPQPIAKVVPAPVPAPAPAPKVEIAKAPAPALAPAKVEVAKADKPSAKVQNAIAAAKADEARKDREARAAARVAKVEPVAKPAKADKPVAKVEKTAPAPTPALVAKADKPVPAKPALPMAKPEPSPAPIAKAEKPSAPPAAMPVAPRLTIATRHREPKPIVVPAPVDQDRLQFLKSREASLASVRFPDLSPSSGTAPASTMDLAGRMKGSILESGLSGRER